MNNILSEARDQALHVLWAFLALLPIAVWQNPLSGALSGFLLGLPRELWDQFLKQGRHFSSSFPWIDARDARDIAFFALGGLILGFVVW